MQIMAPASNPGRKDSPKEWPDKAGIFADTDDINRYVILLEIKNPPIRDMVAVKNSFVRKDSVYPDVSRSKCRKAQINPAPIKML